MLTNNLSEIIHATMERLHSDKRELSSDDLRNLSLLLWGYLRLIKSDFKTKNDSDESIDGYYSALKGILDSLTQKQTNALTKVKHDLSSEYASELLVVDEQLIKLATTLHTNKKALDLLTSARALLQQAINELNKELNQMMGFEIALPIYFTTTNAMKEALYQLIEHCSSPELASCQELMSKITTSHLKKLTYWLDIEQTNLKCSSYVACGEFIDLLTFS